MLQSLLIPQKILLRSWFRCSIWRKFSLPRNRSFALFCVLLLGNTGKKNGKSFSISLLEHAVPQNTYGPFTWQQKSQKFVEQTISYIWFWMQHRAVLKAETKHQGEKKMSTLFLLDFAHLVMAGWWYAAVRMQLIGTKHKAEPALL